MAEVYNASSSIDLKDSNSSSSEAETMESGDAEVTTLTKETLCVRDPTCIARKVMYFSVTFISGALFAFGLALANMTNPNKVLRFLAISDLRKWDPSLGFVMGGGLIFTTIAFQGILRLIKKPVLAEKFGLPTNKNLAWNLVIGPIIFGIGWGIGGICPGPGIVNLVSTNWKMYVWFFGVCLGVYADTLLSRFNAMFNRIKSSSSL
ncbi:sulfur transport [Carpediemonas membranifera]|uniref:Sulfur transport n=1 Tax=Carpediemonas membranifera TaxID=201153 RepID=A0A8J6AY34_9EUKA|nr:sulfur transport [Carpediemonas membranifera]|eukprot:KAG9390079.1 sulfur transport [Carpediemonas membranifera]